MLLSKLKICDFDQFQGQSSVYGNASQTTSSKGNVWIHGQVDEANDKYWLHLYDE